MLFHPLSGVSEVEPRVEYAAVFVKKNTYPELPARMRPVKVFLPGESFPIALVDPDERVATIINLPKGIDMMILGMWAEKITYQISLLPEDMTWRGYVALQYGQVLRQRNLVDRLAQFGIQRKHETYLPFMNTCNAVERSLTLNYDELDALLSAAEVGHGID